MADGGTTGSRVMLVGEEGPEIVIRNPDGTTTVIPNDQITEAQEGGTFLDPQLELRRKLALNPELIASAKDSPYLRTGSDLSTPQLATAIQFGDPSVVPAPGGDVLPTIGLPQRGPEAVTRLPLSSGEPAPVVGDVLPDSRPRVAEEIEQMFGLPTAQSVSQTAQNPQVASGQIAPLSFEDTRLFLNDVQQDALRRGGFTSPSQVSPLKVSAPGTSRFLQDLSASVVAGVFGFGPASLFFEELAALRPQGVGRGVARRTA
jgi:hypothetical protein